MHLDEICASRVRNDRLCERGIGDGLRRDGETGEGIHQGSIMYEIYPGSRRGNAFILRKSR